VAKKKTRHRPNLEGFSKAGLATRRKYLGDKWLDAALDNMTEFSREWQKHATNVVWAGSWTRGVLEKQELSLINLAMLAALNRMAEFELHFRVAVKSTKVPLEKLRELLVHIVVYCGAPVGVEMFAIAKKVFAEEKIDPNDLPPVRQVDGKKSRR
jgi:4-carboxymuconolactone decarboxylase